ncbi:polysaccharide deacetylase family protein [Chitinophaga sp. MM2321]|uniref:polysaccharide deacetylase family protein n=1 Tax=Chitinophaga sp. MM2321 TaxID=3137178 RepID=UPI0032D5AC66
MRMTTAYRLIFSLLLLTIMNEGYAQQVNKWPGGKKAAIVLSYDDGLTSQLDIGIPQLNKYKLTGTFFLTGSVTEDQMLRWRSISKQGFELANHTLYHPCSERMYKNSPQYYAENYDVNTTLREIGMMNKILFGIDGKRTRTFAFPCSESLAGGVDYTDSLKRSGLIKYVRWGGDEKAVITDLKGLNFFRVPSWGVTNSPDGNALIAFVKAAQQKGGLGVFMFHGVGGDYIEVSAQAHEQLLQYLASHGNDVWVATFQEVMDYIAAQRKGKKEMK